MLLDSVSKSIKVVLEAAKTANDCPITAFYVDHTTAGGTPGSSDAATNGTTVVVAVASPAVATQRQVKMITIYNADTAPVTIYTQFVNGGTTRVVNKSVLAVGDTLVYQNEIGFRITQITAPDFLSSGDSVDVTDRAARLLGAITGSVTTDALKASELNIEAVSKDLQVDIQSMPAITGAVTTDALKSSELNIDPAEKLLEVAINDAITRILLNTALPRLQTDVAGRLLVKIDVAGTSTPVTTATHAVTVASGGIASGAIAAGGIALGAIATGAITDLPYKGWDHEGYLSQMAFNGIRDRMEFTS